MKLDNTKIIFAAGAAAGVAIMKILKTRKVRKLTVDLIASSRVVKDKVFEEVTNIFEEADDVYASKKADIAKENDNYVELTEEMVEETEA